MPKLLSIDRTARVAGPALLVLRLKIALTNSPPRRGGVARSAGVVSSAKSRTCRSDHYYGFALSRSRFALALRARLRRFRWLRAIFLVAHPPLLCEEGNAALPN